MNAKYRCYNWCCIFSRRDHIRLLTIAAFFSRRDSLYFNRELLKRHFNHWYCTSTILKRLKLLQRPVAFSALHCISSAYAYIDSGSHNLDAAYLEPSLISFFKFVVTSSPRFSGQWQLHDPQNYRKDIIRQVCEEQHRFELKQNADNHPPQKTALYGFRKLSIQDKSVLRWMIISILF